MGIKYADVLRTEVEHLEAERVALLAELDSIAERGGSQARVGEIEARGSAVVADIAAKLARADELDSIEAERAAAPKQPKFGSQSDRGVWIGDSSGLSRDGLVDQARRALDATERRQL